MHALVWIGIVLLALALLAWVVFRVVIWVGIALFALGVALIIWGVFKVKRSL